MPGSAFIARSLRSGEGLATALVALSFFIVIIAFAVAGGFRREIYAGIRAVSGDILLAPAGFDYPGGGEPVARLPELEARISGIDGIREVRPFVSRGGIVRREGNIQGVIVKGVADSSLASLHARIPSRLCSLLGFSEGEKMTVWFIGDPVQARNFTVEACYDAVASTDENLTVLVPLADMQRLCGWGADSVSAYELCVADKFASRALLRDKAAQVGLATVGVGEEPLFAVSAPDRYPQVFDWLDLVDSNVLVILLLMMLVAGFNMVSSMLILMFRNLSTIGMLKTMGMTSRDVSAVFLRRASRIALRGMLYGDAAALLFCALQHATHFLKLNPQNYYVAWVPVSVNPVMPLLTNLAVYAAILLFTLLPCLFIARVDPARTVRRD